VPILIREPDGPYYSAGDERAFFEWVERIPCVAQVKGAGTQLHIHVRRRRISDACLRELIALFHRYGVAMSQLAQFETSANRGWFSARNKFWYEDVFGSRAKKRVKPPAAKVNGTVGASRRCGSRAGR
jgi:hypothetical protein